MGYRKPYDDSIRSDGLTLDSVFGPVDTVKVERALRGTKQELTKAEKFHAYNTLAKRAELYRNEDGASIFELAQRGLGTDAAALYNGLLRARQRLGLKPPPSTKRSIRSKFAA